MKEWYYTITKSMLDLGLRGTELNLYAVLKAYSQDGDRCFYGTRKTLAERCGVTSLVTINNTLHSLIDRGLVEKNIIEINGTKHIAYSTVEQPQIFPEEGVQKMNSDRSKNEHPTGQKMNAPRSKNEHKNIKDIYINRDINIYKNDSHFLNSSSGKGPRSARPSSSPEFRGTPSSSDAKFNQMMEVARQLFGNKDKQYDEQ